MRSVICWSIFACCIVLMGTFAEWGMTCLAVGSAALLLDLYWTGYEKGDAAGWDRAAPRLASIARERDDADEKLTCKQASLDRLRKEYGELEKEIAELKARLKDSFKVEYELSVAKGKLADIESILTGRRLPTHLLFDCKLPAMTAGTERRDWRSHP